MSGKVFEVSLGGSLVSRSADLRPTSFRHLSLASVEVLLGGLILVGSWSTRPQMTR